MEKHHSKIAALTGVSMLAFGVPANADSVGITKDCNTTPCTITIYAPKPDGHFRVKVPTQPINWDATSLTASQLWITQNSAMNMADVKVADIPATGFGSGQFTVGGSSGTFWYISAKLAVMRAGNYSVSGPNVLGDPHITTLDGVHYDFQGAGEFVLLRNRQAGIEVQSRMTPVSTVSPLPPNAHTGISSCPSINTAAAMSSPAHRITFQPMLGARPGQSQMAVRVDSRIVRLNADGLTLDDKTTLNQDRASGELRVVWSNGWEIRVVPHFWSATGLWYLDYDFTPATSASGVGGPLAAGSWLPNMADGSSLGALPASIDDRYVAIYQKFADSWRVTAQSSLFDYATGTSTDTYANRGWPPKTGSCSVPNTPVLHGATQAVAESACANIAVGHYRRMCVLDVMATGDRTFARGYLLTQGPKRFTFRVSADRGR
jgi:hypothetical protein